MRKLLSGLVAVTAFSLLYLSAEKATDRSQLVNVTAYFLDHPAGYVYRRFTVTASESLTGTWSVVALNLAELQNRRSRCPIIGSPFP